MRSGVSASGRAGLLVPSGIATDDTTKFFFQDIMERRSLVSLYDFENRNGLFPDVHRSYKFCILTLSGYGRPIEGAEFVFFAHETADLADPERRFTLTADDLELLNPNTRTCPVFRTRRDAEITKKIYRRVPVLVKEGPPEENPWGVKFMTMFHMTNDSHLFRTRDELEADGYTLDGNIFRNPGAAEYLPLYEAKMIHHFDHRWATCDDEEVRELSSEEKASTSYLVSPRYWVHSNQVDAELDSWGAKWIPGIRAIAPATNERTIISATIPRTALGNSIVALLPAVDPLSTSCLVACLASFILDFAARQKVGGSNINMFITRQLPAPPPAIFARPTPWAPEQTLADWIVSRVLELTYTAQDLAPWAASLGYAGPPFGWDEDRRTQLRAELDAAFFHLYGVTRDEVDYIMDTFPIVRRKDEATYGTYRTKDLILGCYDEFVNAGNTVGHSVAGE